MVRYGSVICLVLPLVGMANYKLIFPLQEQYEFCHQVLADFLDEFDTYANFKEII